MPGTRHQAAWAEIDEDSVPGLGSDQLGLVQWSGLRTDNLFQPPKCDRYYILMLPNLNCISQLPARIRLCAG